jgi:hypothetical protein
MRNVLFLVALVLSLCSVPTAEAGPFSACANGQCNVRRVAAAPVRAVRSVQPARRVAGWRPLRRVFGR